MTKDYYGTKRVTAWSEKHGSAPGYAVKYADGYVSWSPKEAFEAAYEPVTGMSFSGALAALKAGHKVARPNWGYTYLTTEHVPGGEPWIMSAWTDPRDGQYWSKSYYTGSSDLMATDWHIVA